MIMNLSNETIQALSLFISGGGYLKPSLYYKSGSKLVEFFNKINSTCERYPEAMNSYSRIPYTQNELAKINGTDKMYQCIIEAYNPQNFIENIDFLKDEIIKINKYLKFDKFEILLYETKVVIKCLECNENSNLILKEQNNGFKLNFNIEDLNIDEKFKLCITNRLVELKECYRYKISFTGTVLCGTILEGLLYALSKKYPETFNRANSSPKKDGKVKKIDEWLFNDFLNVSKDIGLISAEGYNFAKCLQDFRNIIHPREQVKNNYNPKFDVFSECINVLNFLIKDILNNSKSIFENK